MKRPVLYGVILFSLFHGGVLFADVSLDYACVEKKMPSILSGGPPKEFDVTYRKKILVTDDLLVFQIISDNAVLNEYGFDFPHQIYYEITPASQTFRKYSFDQIKREYNLLKIEGKATPAGRELFEFPEQKPPFVNYAFKMEPSWFGDTLGGARSTIYTYDYMGSWVVGTKMHRMGKVWMTRELPRYEEYERAVGKLRQIADFYMAKGNKIAQSILFMTDPAGGLPLKMQQESYSDGRVSGKEIMTAYSSKSIDPEKILYLAANAGKSVSDLNAVEDKNGWADRADFSLKKEWMNAKHWTDTAGDIYGYGVLAFFVLGLVRMRMRNKKNEPIFSVVGRDCSFIFVIASILFALECVHYFFPIAYFQSRFVEFSVIIVGIGLLLAVMAAARRVIIQTGLASGKIKKCAHCHEILEPAMTVCPKCDRFV